MIELSIIIPHYNSVTTLIKLLNSIPVKKNIEVIVIDDRSNNDLEKLEELYSCESFKHVKFLENNSIKKGAGVCRNIGLNNSSGEWVLFADADDYFVGDFYGKVSKYFSSNYDVVFFRPTSIELDTDEESDRHTIYENLLLNFSNMNNVENETRLRYQFYVPWSKLIKKSVLIKNDILFDEVIASNDVMFSTQLGYYMNEFEISQDVIYCVTRGTNTLTTNINLDVFESRLKVHIRYCEFLKQNLEKKEYKILRPNGMGMLFNALKLKLGFRKITYIIIQLKKSRIALFDLKILSPLYFFRRLNYHNKKYAEKSKYFKKNE